MTDPTSHVLELPEVDLTYDVRGPIPTADGRPVLLMIGQPMCADGFTALAEQFGDRTVVTYDPRGLGRSSTRHDGRTDQNPVDQTLDLHRLVEHLAAGPVDVFASSGGAVTALEWAATHPLDLHLVVAHEPPALWALPDAEAANRANDEVGAAYQAEGFGAGMARFLSLISWQGVFTEAYFRQAPLDPQQMGLPTHDDGSRDDPLLSQRSAAITRHRHNVEDLLAAPTTIVIAVGEETGDALPARTARGIAEALHRDVVVFPSHHGGFGVEGGPHGGRPAEFAAKLREVLDAHA